MGKIFKDGVRFENGQMVVEENGEVQEIITTSDTKQFFSTAINQFFMQNDPDADTGWQDIFRVIPGTGHGMLMPFRPIDATTQLTATNTATFLAAEDALSVGSHGIVFEEVGEGGEVKFSRTVAAEKYVKHVKYMAAIGYSNEWFEDGQMPLIEMVTEDFRRSAADKLAAIHYGAIVAAPASGISTSAAHSNAAAGSITAGLINTLNVAVAAMRRNKAYPDILLVAPENEQPARLALAQTVKGGRPDAVQTEGVARLRIIVTEFIPSGTAYVIESKKRLVSTNRLALSLGNFKDLLHDAETLVGKFRRGVLVGEGRCIRRITSMPTTLDAAYDI